MRLCFYNMLLCLSVGREFLYPVILISIVICAECYGEIFKIGIENIFTVTLGGYVYCYYPGIVTHADIALIWDIGGIRLIDDMLPTARKIEEAENCANRARREYEKARDCLNALLAGFEHEPEKVEEIMVRR